MDLMKRHTTKRTYSSLKDRELVHLFRKKADESAFNELLTRHQSKIYSYIYSMVNNPEVANDIFQETFTKVVTKMDDTYNEQGKWIAWVMRIAHNATIDHIRNSSNNGLKIEGILRTMFDSRNNLSNDVSEQLKEYFPNELYKTKIPRNIRVAEAPSFGKSILEYDGLSKGSLSYYSLAGEIIKDE